MTWNTFLKLGRVSNLPTVWTNAMAGAVLAGVPEPLPILVAGLCLSLFYTGGMWLNDAFDAKIDALERKERPIPMGDIEVGAVYAGGFAILAAGVLLTFSLGSDAGFAGMGLAFAVILYDWLHKRTVLSPLIMGITRFFCYVLGALAVADITGPVLLAALGLLAYIVGLTYAAKKEAYDRLDNVWPLMFMAFPLLYAFTVAVPQVLALAIWIGLLVVMLVALGLLKRRHKGDVPKAVATLIAGISLYDAALIAGAGQVLMALLAVVGFLLTLLLQRAVSGT